MGKARYISDGKIFFVKVTVILKDGKNLTAIDDTAIADIDSNWQIYFVRAKEKWRGNIDSFQVVQLSKHDPEVKWYIKQMNIHLPANSADDEPSSFEELKLSKEAIGQLNKKPRPSKHQPGKYRS
jgi:hypothetical protein